MQLIFAYHNEADFISNCSLLYLHSNDMNYLKGLIAINIIVIIKHIFK